MENKHNNIDLFYREQFSGHRENLGTESWGKMKWRLFWLDFRYYAIALTALLFIGASVYFAFLFTNPDQAVPLEHTMQTENVSTKPEADAELLPSVSKPIVESTSATEVEQPNQMAATSNAIHQLNTPTEETIIPSAEMTEFKATETNPDKNANGIIINSLTFLETKKKPVQLGIHPEENLIIDTTSSPLHDIRKKSWISISFYVAPAYTNSTLTADNAFDEELKYRNDHETGAISWSAGADVQFNIRNWYIQTGLSYSTFSNNRNYNHSFKAPDSLNSYYSKDTTWAWVYDPPHIGYPIVLSIDSTYIQVFNEINEGVNRWNYLEIPLLIGYTFHFNRFSLDIGSGVSYGILLGASGNVPSLSEENLFTELSELEPQMNKHTFNYILQIGASYHLTPQWSLIVKPFYKQNLQSVFEKNYPIDQRFKAFSIKFGLKVDL